MEEDAISPQTKYGGGSLPSVHGLQPHIERGDHGMMHRSVPGDDEAPEVCTPAMMAPKPWFEDASLYYPPTEVALEKNRTKTCGLALSTLLLLVALIVAILVAAVVGGLVGSNAVESAREEGFRQGLDEAALSTDGSGNNELLTTITTTVTTTASPSSTGDADPDSDEGFIPPRVTSLFFDCPGLDASTVPVDRGEDRYNIECGRVPKMGRDITTIISYAFGDCMQACSSYNVYRRRHGDDEKCVGVLFFRSLAIQDNNFGNCFLKGNRTETKVSPGGHDRGLAWLAE